MYVLMMMMIMSTKVLCVLRESVGFLGIIVRKATVLTSASTIE